MKAEQKEIVIALCKGNMRVSEAAQIVPCARNNVMYHIGRIREKTGLDPMNFFDLIKLYRMATKGFHRGWPRISVRLLRARMSASLSRMS